ncbi:MAG: endonuclease III [Candidatus Methylomirabilota bacterium]
MQPTVKLARVGVLLLQAYGPRRQTRRRDNPLDWILRALLSQGSTDDESERAYTALRLRLPTYEDIHRAPLGSLIRAIRGGGLANQKAVRIKALLEEIWGEQGHFDLSFLRDLSDEEVRAYLGRFKGIGPKTIACVLLFGLGRSAFPVDGHVLRVCRRLGLLNGQRTPESVQAYLEPCVPAAGHYALRLHLAEHGRKVCHPQRPDCEQCPLAKLCNSARS